MSFSVLFCLLVCGCLVWVNIGIENKLVVVS